MCRICSAESDGELCEYCERVAREMRELSSETLRKWDRGYDRGDHGAPGTWDYDEEAWIERVEESCDLEDDEE